MRGLLWRPAVICVLFLSGCQDAPKDSSGRAIPPVPKIRDWDIQTGAADPKHVEALPGVELLSLDGFSTPAAEVRRLRGGGLYLLCAVEVGRYEPWRPDAAQFPDTLKLSADPDRPEQFFLDIRGIDEAGNPLAELLRQRLLMCRAKGFDALDPGTLDVDRKAPAGPVTEADQLAFNGWLADEAHAAGLRIFYRNGAGHGLKQDPQGRPMADLFDGVLNERCFEYGRCAGLQRYVERRKLVLNVEYQPELDCPAAQQGGILTIWRDSALHGAREPGYRRGSCQYQAQ